MRYMRKLISFAAALVLMTLCCCANAEAQAAIEKRRPQGKANFSTAYQNVFDFLQEYTKSGGMRKTCRTI